MSILCKKFKEVFHTQWLSFDGALHALLQNYSSLVSLFLEETSGKALARHNPITSYKFLYVAHYLADVMEYLSRFNRMYQKSDQGKWGLSLGIMEGKVFSFLKQ